MQTRFPFIAVFLLTILPLSAKWAAAEGDPEKLDLDPEKVFAYKGGVTLTQQEIDAVFSKLPESERLLFIRDGAKVDKLVSSLLQRKIIVRDAMTAEYHLEPLIAVLLDLEWQKALAEAWMQKIMQEAPQADFEALAYEHYLANQDAYRSEVQLDISHILLSTESRGESAARDLAASLLSQLDEAPDRFDEFVKTYSDDPVKQNNGGRYVDMRRGMMVKPFEDAAFALENVGQISEPVKTEYGYHLILLNGRSGNERQEFSDVKAQAIVSAKERYYSTYRQNYLRRVLSDPIIIPEGAVEIMARRHFGEDLELAPGRSQ